MDIIDVVIDPVPDISVAVSADSSDIDIAQEAVLINDHTKLTNKDANNQHPISAITGLGTRLDDIEDDIDGHDTSIAEIEETLEIKQDTLTAGDNMVIEDNVISVKSEKLPAGFIYGDDYLLYLADEDGNTIGEPVEIHGGQSEETEMDFTTSSDVVQTIAQGASCVLEFDWSSVKGTTPTGTGSYTVKVNGSAKKTSNVGQGEFSVDVSSYLVAGSNTVAVTVSDMYNTNRTITFSIDCIVLTISSRFDNSTPFTNTVAFAYTPVGAVTKTVHFYVDGTEIGTQVVSESGWEQIYVIPKQAHGKHSLLVYFTATLDGISMSSNGLYYEFMSLDTGVNTPIIASDFQSTVGEQYIALSIPYYVYTPNSLTSAVSIKVGDEEVASYDAVDRTLQAFSYTFEDYGTKTITFTTGSVTRTFTLTISQSTINVQPVETGKQLFYTVTGRSNLEEHPEVWKDSVGNVAATLTNFNFVSDGWLTDSDGNEVLRINNGASVSIPFKIFEEDFRSSGKTIEFEIATRDVMDYDCTIISCMDAGVGFKATPQLAQFSSEQTSIETPYKEDEHIRISFVVENRTSTSRMICMYVNGILSAAEQYPTDDGFSQVTPVGISIGNENCTVDIYAIRIYSIALSRQQIVNNWIADTQNGTLKKDRYTRNNIYNAYGKINIAQLPADLPYMIVETAKLPTAKGDKQSANVTYTDPVDADLSFEATGGSIDVQGTSSQGYYRKNFKIKYKTNGFVINGTPSAKYALRGASKNIPVNVFTYKADVASSEGVNNVELVRLYNDFEPYTIPPKRLDSRVRSGIDGLPIVMFHNDGDTTEFYGKMNFNNDKETGDTYGFKDGDMMFSTENNTSLRTLFQSGEGTDEEYLEDFEYVYPDGCEDSPTKLKELVAWVASTYRKPTDSDTVKAQKLQKFKDEIEDYIYLDSALYFYCFTELFLMVDSWAKNCFPKYFADEDLWYFHAYDMDTAIGINNEGKFVYSYGLETDDTQAGADVMNARHSALWCNLRDAFPDKIQAMYQKMRSKGLSYEKVVSYFEGHQAKWSENIFNEDSYVKYIYPLIIGATGGPYLPKLHGSKAEQNRWWLYNRFKYMDSKYISGDAKSDIITIRAYAKDNLKLTPYADLYCGCSFGGKVVNIRGKRNTQYTLNNPLDTVNDTEYFIYSSSQLKDVGDLSGHKPGSVDFASAVKLQSLKIGDGASSYSNPNLTELTVGNNKLLKKIDVRNCPNLAQSIDLSNCTALEEVYFTGTSVKGVQLANGGVVKKLHLPDTLVNLSLLNQQDLEECTVAGGENLTTLRVENTPVVDTKTLCEEATAGTKVRLLNVDWTFDDADEMLDMLDKLDSFRGLDETGLEQPKVVITGKFKVPTATIQLINQVQSRYGWITLEYDTCILNLTFKNYDGTVLKTDTCTRTMSAGGSYTYTGTAPTRADTVIEGVTWHYNFNGWDKSLTNILTDTVFTAQYVAKRYYTVTFVNYNESVLEIDMVVDGQKVSYHSETPTRPASPPYLYEFSGWDYDLNEPITENKTITALYNTRQPKVYYKLGDTIIQTVSVAYGGDAEYTGATPTEEGKLFAGWIGENKIQKAIDVRDDMTLQAEMVVPDEQSGNAYYKLYDDGELLMFNPTDSYGANTAYSGDKSLVKSIRVQEGISSFSNYTLNNSADYYFNATELILPSTLNFGTSNAFAYYNNFTIGTLRIPTWKAWIEAGRYSFAHSPTFSTNADVYVNGEKADYDNLVIKNANYFKDLTFYNWRKVKKISFENCRITSLGENSISKCTNLQTIKFPATLTSIGNYAFNGSNAIKSYDCTELGLNADGSVKTTISGYSFYGANTNVPFIFATEEIANAYKTATNWSKYSAYITYVGA